MAENGKPTGKGERDREPTAEKDNQSAKAIWT